MFAFIYCMTYLAANPCTDWAAKDIATTGGPIMLATKYLPFKKNCLFNFYFLKNMPTKKPSFKLWTIYGIVFVFRIMKNFTLYS